MRLFQLAELVSFILLSGAFATLPAQAVVPAYASSKLRLCQPCVMPSVPIAIPQRGIVLSYGGIFSDGSKWYLIDFARVEATRVLARLDRSTSKQTVVEQVTRPLSPGELSLLTQLVNRIWASEEPLPSAMATDVVWNLWLLDAGDVRNDFGAGRPDGLAKEVEQIIRRLVEPEVPIQPSENTRFVVSYTGDYGYSLHSPDDFNKVVIPAFEKEDVLEEFHRFFSNENLQQLVGKKVYCDCVGEYYNKNEVIFFRISKAHLFAG